MSLVLVTGGAGYVGSHSVLMLKERGHEVIVIDDLSTGTREFANNADEFHRKDITCKGAFSELYGLQIDCILHCAGKAIVPESIKYPDAYWKTNLIGTKNLVDAFPTTPIVFSSTCAVYGVPKQLPITIDTPASPITPYGYSKLAAEYLIRGYKHAIFRYFNVAGADIKGQVGEFDRSYSRLVPNLLHAAAMHEEVFVYRANEQTDDTTCVREYVHPTDLARAHADAIDHLIAGGQSFTMNLGGARASTLDVVRCVERNMHTKIDATFCPPREGDPAVLYTAPAGSENKIRWYRQHDLQSIVASAAVWWTKTQKIQLNI